MFVCEQGIRQFYRGTCGRHAGSGTERINENSVAGTRERHGDALVYGN